MANNGNNEIPLVNTILMKDEKNYHAWQHRFWFRTSIFTSTYALRGEVDFIRVCLRETLKRQWAIKTYSMYSGEMDLVDQFLTKDIYNNSAWNHRYFIINNTRLMMGDSGKSPDSGCPRTRITTHIEFLVDGLKM